MSSQENQASVITVCYGKHFEFNDLIKYCEQHYRSTRYRSTLHLEMGEGDVYVFAYATIVYWNISDPLRQQIEQSILPFLSEPMAQCLQDELSFSYGESFTLHNDHLVLDSKLPLVKLAISHTLAQSVKLEMFEEQVEQTIKETSPIPKYLAEHGKIKLSRNQIARMRGSLYLTKSSVNLHYELLDKPDFFWEYPELDHYYHQTEEYQELTTRLDILNRKLEVIQEMLNLLADETNHQHSAVLEWIIIWLIAVEIVIFFVHDLFKWV